MPLTNTTHLSSFTRPGTCTFAFSPPPSSPDSPQPPTIVTLPPGSSLTTQLHFHLTHTEYLRVVSAAVLVTINGHSRILTAEDGVAEVPRGARHEWMRFDRSVGMLRGEQKGAQERWIKEKGEGFVKELREKELVVEEWTDPADGEKEVFFRNLFSTFEEPAYVGRWMGWGSILAWLQVMSVMWEGDNFVVVVDCGGGSGGWRRMMEDGFAYALMGGAWTVGRMVGCKGVNREYTPEHLMERWKGSRVTGSDDKKSL